MGKAESDGTASHYSYHQAAELLKLDTTNRGGGWPDAFELVQAVVLQFPDPADKDERRSMLHSLHRAISCAVVGCPSEKPVSGSDPCRLTHTRTRADVESEPQLEPPPMPVGGEWLGGKELNDLAFNLDEWFDLSHDEVLLELFGYQNDAGELVRRSFHAIVNREELARWLRENGEQPTELVRAWLGDAWDRARADVLPNERESMLKLIAGLAKPRGLSRDYGVPNTDGTVPRSAVTGKVKLAVQNAGLTIDEQTVRRYLKEAASLLRTEEAR